ncbi:MAG: 2-C-methyl-D-erythritol 4-phosphate cytidylyltransferase [Cellvibrionales bacterium]|nr:2-C-methyl-D-erythritol 4-phosphate cytidylyltransferase [Cellvibrionales bacterium]
MKIKQLHMIFLAAGRGTRFGDSTPKQYAPLADRPLIEHSLITLLDFTDKLTLALAADDHHWPQLKLATDPRIRTVTGGATRAESARNALLSLRGAKPQDWVLVHDAARPLLAASDLHKLLAALADEPVGALLATPIRATVKRADSTDRIIRTEDRRGLWSAATPQIFRYSLLYEGLQQADDLAQITDEASAVESLGHSPQLIEGTPSNIKITTPADLAFAELLLRARQLESKSKIEPARKTDQQEI